MKNTIKIANLFKLIIIFLISFFLLLSETCNAELKQKEVITFGQASTESDAINNALIRAVAQVKGLAINSNEITEIRYKVENAQKTSGRDMRKNIQTATGGVISKYEILSTDKDENGLFKIQIRATIPYYEAGNQINRLRLAIAPMRISNKVSNNRTAKDFIESWNNTLEESLVQTRRFAVVDRSFGNEIDNELKSYMDQGFNISELARIGQKIGTDYLIVGEVRKYNISDKSVYNPLDDTKIARSALNVDVSLRIVDVATGQIKFAKSYDSPNKAVTDIINAIYPMVILSTDNFNVVIGSGGDELKIGSRYRVMALGKELKDPYTGESLGKQEVFVGEIEITDVQFKTSQAKILKGQDKIIESLPNGLIIRPLINSQQSSSPKTTKEKTGKKTEENGDQDW